MEAEQLTRLREYVESLGGRLDGGWRCRANIRDFGSRAGSMDLWFTAPHGETFRSKVAVSGWLGALPLCCVRACAHGVAGWRQQ